ncbi:D-alanyl-D-alanine carboxypeptidase [Consotaella aegiceratis]|uniref:D-alanyl-D-alanine carboxypeptidase n=1 Tax=Consotaella aegiceratis TaxID=3097961 RepID=UPI002F41F23F
MRIAFPSLKSATACLVKIVGAVAVGAVFATQLSTPAAAANEKYAGFVIDANNGNVLYSSHADEPRYPASLTKMMTIYLTFEALREGRISMSTQMPVSSYAAARPPSKLGLKPGSTISVRDDVLGLITRSANDGAVVLAEFLGGSEAKFAQMMTAKARQLGMRNTVFKNANGLPNSAQHTTARDMATLGIALRAHFPQYYSMFATRSYTFRGQKIPGHNRVLDRVEGADGIKTGFINASGFNLVTSVKRDDGRNVVAVVLGGRTGTSRDNEMVDLLGKYLPKASTRSSGPLVASYSPSASSGLPENVPVPTARFNAVIPADAVAVAVAPQPQPQMVAVAAPAPTSQPREMTIEERIAMAYEMDEAAAIPARTPIPNERPILGREALRQALMTPARGPAIEIPTAVGYAPSAPSAPSAPVPPAAIPGGRDLDPTTTGSIAVGDAELSPTSPWVVQIAAVPERQNAMAMLSEAKSKVGSALSDAQPFTETVDSQSQVLYRARFAGFTTKDEAWDACAALKRHSYACYAVAN